MKEYIVSYDIAVKLKEKGFPMPKRAFFGIYEDDKSFRLRQVRPYRIQGIVIAPTIRQVLKWLRDEKKIYVVVTPYPSMSTKDKVVWCYQIKHNSDGAFMEEIDGLEIYMFHRRAALGGIEYVLDNLI